MLVNGAPECIQINQMICLPFVPRTRTNYQATADVLKATFYFYSHNTQYVQNKTTIHLASASCWLSHYIVQIASNYSVIPLVLLCSFLSKVVLVSPAPCVSVPHVCLLRNCLTSSVITFRFFFGIGMVTGKVWSISVVCIRWFGNLT